MQVMFDLINYFIMKNLLFMLTISLMFSCSSKKFEAKHTSLESKWDTIRPIANPDKGWYHHMLDNGIHRYLIQDEKDLTDFPGMDHLYLRLAWAYLEPEEGVYDWSYIDDIVEKYVPMGYHISFRISCKETGTVPETMPYKVDGIAYATPYWVKQAGAKGIDNPEYGPGIWTPDWNDPVYLEKLDNFHKAFAAKYDGKPWMRYVDVGSIGDWGEGHTWRSTRVPVTVDEIKTHINLHLKHYKNSKIIISDDLIYYRTYKNTQNISDDTVYTRKLESEQKELLDFALTNGVSFRDDSPLVKGVIRECLDTWSVRAPLYFEKAYKTMPTVFELEHYSKVKNQGDWRGKNGSEVIPDLGVSGADVFSNSMKIIRPTYIGFHGYLGEWLEDNPDLTIELLNLCGYWFFPKSINTTQYKNGELSFDIEWFNKGVAPAYSEYQLRGKLIPIDNGLQIIEFVIDDSGNMKWMPDELVSEKYKVSLPEKPKGEYVFAIQLFDTKSQTPVEIGLAIDLKNDHYFEVQNLIF